MNSTTPEAVVQRQLDAYNARDIERFIESWAPDAQYSEHPASLLASGREAIRARHVERFREPNLHGKLVKRMVMGNKVVDQESVTRTFPEGTGNIEVIAIYEIDNGLIAKAWFIMGPRILDTKA
jgi:uncharacterized protein (TIGR02246 family)